MVIVLRGCVWHVYTAVVERFICTYYVLSILCNIVTIGLTLATPKLFSINTNSFPICICYYSPTLLSQMELKSFLVESNDPPILHYQCHCCWCPGTTWSRDIDSISIDVVPPECYSFGIRMVNTRSTARIRDISLAILNDVNRSIMVRHNHR